MASATSKCPTSSGWSFAAIWICPSSARIGDCVRAHEWQPAREEQAARFDRNRDRIEEECGAAGPAIFAVQALRIVRMFPR